MILARAAYLGAQRNGTVFWSSDIVSTWDMLKRSVPAGLNFTATGLPYWDTDIAGFYPPTLPADYHAAHTPLIDGSDARDVIGNNEDYPELFTRWFEWGCFQPVMRAQGGRLHNEVWSCGKQAEPILVKYLKLRYQLLPYTYSVAYKSYQTGAPYMRALFMDFPNDAKAANICMDRPSWWLRSRNRERLTGPYIYPRGATGTTTGPMSGCTADKPWW
jgi:alpha-D-xyloside xylohydrolase